MSFYRHFLLRLFHEGLGSRNRNPELDELLGNVPFLNGGLFDVHELEEHNPDIAIADKAFERLLDFFDAYSWHLDERPLRNDNEINPDVLGYIFEKYVNQKQMGAYYTKEDITDYIAKNTIIPCLFDKAKRDCPVAFEPDSPLWALLSDDPDRYIYPAVRHGVMDEEGKVISLPASITPGVDDVSKRGCWNDLAEAPYALPTETWREHVGRKTRCLEIRDKLAAGEVHEIDDLITLNLDICQFALDAIQNCEGPAVLRAFYHAIAGRMPEKSNQHFRPGISVLDPTCGSGAFLFAALNILEPLYEACLQRMRSFLEEEKPPCVPSVEDEIKATIAAGESATVEFKSTARWDVRQKCPNKAMERVIVESVVAFLNAKGGTLLIGVEDNGEIFGLDCDYQVWGKKGNRDQFENWLLTRLTDHFGKSSVTLLAVDFACIEGKDVCRVIVQPSPTAVYLKEAKADHFWVRVGNSKRELSTSDAVKYINQRFDDQPLQPPYVPVVAPAAAVTGRVRNREFQRLLAQAAGHPNQRYFILKSIIIGNLFGVDIMEEAVEICKLRLFLKLVAQVDTANQIEPLPDVDFNIRCGNTLVGLATLRDVERAVTVEPGGQRRLMTSEDEATLKKIRERADVVDRACQLSRRQQTELGGAVTHKDKHALRCRLKELSDELDKDIAQECGVRADDERSFGRWKVSHRPLHWFAEFYRTMNDGGFDVIIGNPPYVEIPKDLNRSLLRTRFLTALDRWSRDEDLYTLITERSLSILNQKDGRFGMILPLSLAFSTKRPFQILRELLAGLNGSWWWSHFDRIPSALFGNDVRTRCTIAVFSREANCTRAMKRTTSLKRWPTECRDTLFALLRYATIRVDIANGIPKVDSQVQADGLAKMMMLESPLGLDLPRSIPFRRLADSAPDFPQPAVYVGGTAYNWFPVWRDIPPTTNIDGARSLPARTAGYQFRDQKTADAVFALLGSSMGYWWWAIASDGFNLKKWLLDRFPVSVSALPDTAIDELAKLGRLLRRELKRHYVYKDNKGRIGNYFLPACKAETEAIDAAISRHVPGLTNEFFADIQRFNASFSRADEHPNS